eukprot:CAMPEP_0183572582 /NCGR_PEP_ID=MMETSP0371-20130417/128863_1 /TAXON_ID=268820 /ORGANISM="Peridinium aciculiferum, Strain PAER-2" /LENGTH=152 /DNA_ID=CAMNT_0025782449 /DNA_START=226 /DNA_END=680 /DNA_ORIENTATION=+
MSSETSGPFASSALSMSTPTSPSVPVAMPRVSCWTSDWSQASARPSETLGTAAPGPLGGSESSLPAMLESVMKRNPPGFSMQRLQGTSGSAGIDKHLYTAAFAHTCSRDGNMCPDGQWILAVGHAGGSPLTAVSSGSAVSSSADAAAAAAAA